jgi:hypothetical protein
VRAAQASALVLVAAVAAFAGFIAYLVKTDRQTGR